MFSLLFVAETVVNSINNDNIYSFCNPSVEEKNESQNSPQVKRAKTSLTKQSKKTSPARDHGKKQCLFLKQATYCKDINNVKN